MDLIDAQDAQLPEVFKEPFITIGNLANLSILSPDISGPEQFLAGRPLLPVTVIFVQIVVSLVLVGTLARRHRGAFTETSSADRQLAAQDR